MSFFVIVIGVYIRISMWRDKKTRLVLSRVFIKNWNYINVDFCDWIPAFWKLIA
jgi:hypothetical protein